MKQGNMMKANRFTKGSGVYKCRCCEHNTRDTGGGGANVQICDLCYELAGFENMVQDGMQNEFTQRQLETIVDYVEKVYARGGKRVWDDLLVEVAKVCEERM